MFVYFWKKKNLSAKIARISLLLPVTIIIIITTRQRVCRSSKRLLYLRSRSIAVHGNFNLFIGSCARVATDRKKLLARSPPQRWIMIILRAKMERPGEKKRNYGYASDKIPRRTTRNYLRCTALRGARWDHRLRRRNVEAPILFLWFLNRARYRS